MAGYIPTQIQAGQTNGTIFRGENLWVRQGGRLENFQGILDLGENITLLPTSGTLTLVAGSRTVVGAGTKFTTEIVQGNRILVGGELFVVGFVLDDNTLLVTRAPSSSIIAPAFIPFMLVPVDTDRGAIVSGSAQFYRDGIILAVGQGPFHFNGQKLFDFDARLTVYGVAVGVGLFQAGLTTAPELVAGGGSITAVGGGTKGMLGATYSVRLARRRNQTKHVGNAGPFTPITITTGQRIQIVAPPVDTTQGQDSWVLYVTFQGATSDQANTYGRIGPWYAIDTINDTAPHIYEWADAELTATALAEYDADVPPHASFFAVISDTVVLESCHGNNAINPGPFIRAARTRNPEAFPPQALAEVTPPEPIIGVLEGVGRLYLMTENALHIATLTGQTDTPLTIRPFWKTGFSHQNSAAFVNGTIYGFSGGTPTRSRDDGGIGTEEHEFAARVRDIVAAWHPERVFVGHDPVSRAVVFIHANDEKRSGRWVSTALCYMLETDSWSTPMVLDDTQTDLVVTGLCTAGGKLYVEAFGLQKSALFTTGSIVSATNQLTVGNPGLFAVGDHIQVLGAGLGGKPLANTITGQPPMVTNIVANVLTLDTTASTSVTGTLVEHAAYGRTFQWDTNSGSRAVSGYCATPFMDAGAPGFFKTVRRVQVIARLQVGTMGLYRNNDYAGLTTSTSLAPTGARNLNLTSGIGDEIALENGSTILLESGLDTLATEQEILSTLDVAVYPWWKTNLRLAKTLAARIEWSWPGSGPLVSIDELSIHGEIEPNTYY